jgi:hypothetical protein
MDLGYDMNQEMDFGTDLKKNKTAPVDPKASQKEAYDWFK